MSGQSWLTKTQEYFDYCELSSDKVKIILVFCDHGKVIQYELPFILWPQREIQTVITPISSTAFQMSYFLSCFFSFLYCTGGWCIWGTASCFCPDRVAVQPFRFKKKRKKERKKKKACTAIITGATKEQIVFLPVNYHSDIAAWVSLCTKHPGGFLTSCWDWFIWIIVPGVNSAVVFVLF